MDAPVYNSSKLSVACLCNRIERLEEVNLALLSRVLKLEGAMSQVQEHMDKVFTLETDVDVMGDIVYDLQQMHADQLRVNRM